MLKLTYTETGFYLERLAQPLEEWVTTRILVALRAGTRFTVEPSTAAFLLPADLPHLAQLQVEARREDEAIAFSVCDADYIEVCLKGTWLTCNPQGEEGIFVVAMSDRTEFFLSKLWQDSLSYASAIE
ncbi:MAG: hypothetical protein F6K32_07330 [Desertifilum sp. SIO1I2]|nr:hypothetical protein [Desertifilum sp. SIO1I2]